MTSKKESFFKFIVIIEKSDIIKAGLLSMLKEHNLGMRFSSFDNLNSCFTSIPGSVCPDLIIINPELIDESVDKMKSRYDAGSAVLWVALVYAFFDKSLIDAFDETICIDDDDDVILTKLKMLRKKNSSEHSSPLSGNKLSEREIEVLKLLIKGYSNKEAADILSISPHTVISHRKNIIDKTGIRSLAGLAVYAIINNISEINDINK